VTATRPSGGQDGDVIKKVTASDPSGVYRFPDLAEGVWTITVQMFGFTPVTREIKIPPDAPPPAVELALLPLAEITRGLATQTVEPPVAAATAPRAGSPSSSNGGNAPAAPAGRGAGPGPRGGFQRAAANPNAAPMRFIAVELRSADHGSIDDVPQPDHVTVLNNSRVHIQRVRLAAGESIPAHQHVNGFVSVVVRGGEGPGVWRWHGAGEASVALDAGRQPLEVVEIEPK